jgi:hypothetical protein
MWWIKGWEDDSAYFKDVPTHTAKDFLAGFKMNKDLFMWIVFATSGSTPPTSVQERLHQIVGPSIQKCMAALQHLAYGAPLDAQVDYLSM